MRKAKHGHQHGIEAPERGHLTDRLTHGVHDAFVRRGCDGRERLRERGQLVLVGASDSLTKTPMRARDVCHAGTIAQANPVMMANATPSFVVLVRCGYAVSER